MRGGGDVPGVFPQSLSLCPGKAPVHLGRGGRVAGDGAERDEGLVEGGGTKNWEEDGNPICRAGCEGWSGETSEP